MGARRRARESGLQLLYQLEAGEKARPRDDRRPEQRPKIPLAAVDEAALESAMSDFFVSFEAPERTREYTVELVRGVVRERARVDEILERHSPRWRVDRMSLVDRNVLRIGVYELLFSSDVPRKVILDECVEIAKRFGSEQSSAFVNGVLDSASKELRPEGEREERP